MAGSAVCCRWVKVAQKKASAACASPMSRGTRRDRFSSRFRRRIGAGTRRKKTAPPSKGSCAGCAPRSPPQEACISPQRTPTAATIARASQPWTRSARASARRSWPRAMRSITPRTVDPCRTCSYACARASPLRRPVRGLPPTQSATCARLRTWRVCSKATSGLWRERSRSSTPAAFPSRNSSTNIPRNQRPPAKHRKGIWKTLRGRVRTDASRRAYRQRFCTRSSASWPSSRSFPMPPIF